jgi:hypothetical protein
MCGSLVRSVIVVCDAEERRQMREDRKQIKNRENSRGD